MQHYTKEPILALATATGKSAIAVIRISGTGTISITNQLFQGAKELTRQPSHTVHFGTMIFQEQVIDEVLVTIFRAPYSFTKEESVEISCHGAPYIIRTIIEKLIEKGVRLAKPGEFTQRAFLNGRFDLVQAEAVADLIAADTALAHKTALQQMRGGFSKQLKEMRQQLIHLCALLELELDFVEEDVAFADKNLLGELIQKLRKELEPLINSFQIGNVIKNGLPIAIVGQPNVGKSTLLNAMLNEDLAIVSPIPGTTRDLIEAQMYIGDVQVRFIDTAGLRDHTTDAIEEIGIKKTKARMGKASLLLYVFDLSIETISSITTTLTEIEKLGIPLVKVGNKMDIASPVLLQDLAQADPDFVYISAANKVHLEMLKEKILQALGMDDISTVGNIVVNARHYESLYKSNIALEEAAKGLAIGLSNDLLMVEVKSALHYLGEITGEITSNDILDELFSNFCIGK